MPANFQTLQAEIENLRAQVASTVGTENSAVALIEGFAAAIQKAVTDALTADDAADQGSIDVVTAAIAEVKTQFSDSAAKLGAAVAANPK